MKSHSILRFILVFLILLIVIIFIYFNIPYSPLKKDFENDVEMAVLKEGESKGVFIEDDFKDYPMALQMYVKNNGYIGRPKMNYMHLQFKDVEFYQNPDRKLIIDYNQYNFAHSATRLAFIDASMLGIPFQGYDYYKNGKGGMHGVLGKNISLFHELGRDMDQGSLCTYLSESVLLPSSILYNDIKFEEIEPLKLKATLTNNGISASGIFTFNESYEITSFYTKDRPAVKNDGSVDYIPWQAHFLAYKIDDDGINKVTRVKVTWAYPNENFDYFVGDVYSLDFY